MNSNCFLTICLNPTLQKTFVFKELYEDEVNRCPEHYLDASGKGVNVSRVLCQLGQNVIHLTQTGGRNRDLFHSLVEKDHIHSHYVESGSEIRSCYTLLNRKNQTTTEIIEETEPVSPDIEGKITEAFLDLLPVSHTVIISGTKAPGFSDEIYPKMVKEAKKAGKTVILDLKGNDLVNAISFSPDFIKPNFAEFISTFFQKTMPENDSGESLLELVYQKMEQLNQDYGITSILTRGRHGALFWNEGKCASIPATIIQPVNTIGCGDAFTAGFAAAWHQEQNIIGAVEKGMHTARLNALSIRPGDIQETNN